jgi:murein L,D-transpeptidase YafK
VIGAIVGGSSNAPGAELPRADRILVFKAKRRLELWKNGTAFIAFPIALGSHPQGPKHKLGDGRTPEGIYIIDGRITSTPYHLALHVSYPDADDLAHARRAGINPGGAIYVHGMPARFGHTDPVRFFHDWTNGCIAVGNIAIEVIWASVADGTPIEIRP